MNDLKVSIKNLDPMRVVSAHGFGESPEIQAWDKLLAWARPKGLLDELADHRFFGFNNPDPSPGSPNYGYEQWITISPEIEVDEEDDVVVKEIPGGRYAVTQFKGIANIGAAWKGLVTWVEDSPYQFTPQQCLEEMLNPQVFIPEQEGAEVPESVYDEMIFALYIAVTE